MTEGNRPKEYVDPRKQARQAKNLRHARPWRLGASSRLLLSTERIHQRLYYLEEQQFLIQPRRCCHAILVYESIGRERLSLNPTLLLLIMIYTPIIECSIDLLLTITECSMADYASD